MVTHAKQKNEYRAKFPLPFAKNAFRWMQWRGETETKFIPRKRERSLLEIEISFTPFSPKKWVGNSNHDCKELLQLICFFERNAFKKKTQFSEKGKKVNRGAKALHELLLAVWKETRTAFVEQFRKSFHGVNTRTFEEKYQFPEKAKNRRVKI